MSRPSVCEDHLAAGLYPDWNDFDGLRQILEDARPRPPVKFNLAGQDIYLAGQHFAISMTGKSVGGAGGPYYEFVLTNEKLGIEILIAGKPSLGPFCANVRFTLHGRFFLQHGDARSGYELVKRVVEELGGQITRSEVSRVDIALDLPGVDISEFLVPYEAGHFVKKPKTTTTYVSDCENLYFGKAGSQIRCCIYDKLCEARGKGTLEQMRYRRWGGVIPDSATRVEYRVRRQALKTRGISSVEDLFEKEGDLLESLTTKWLRFTAGPVDRAHNNQQRAETLPLWAEVQRLFVEGVGGLTGKPLAPLPKIAADVTQLGKQAAGVVLRAATEEQRDLPDMRAFNAYARKLMAPHAAVRLPLVFL
jgi:hypothetical protein